MEEREREERGEENGRSVAHSMGTDDGLDLVDSLEVGSLRRSFGYPVSSVFSYVQVP